MGSHFIIFALKCADANDSQEVNLPDLAMCHAHSVSCHLRPHEVRARKSLTRSRTLFADTFSRARA